MSLTAIINLAERLLSNTSDRLVDANSNSRQSQQTSRANSDNKIGDQFTPSSANQQDAGLFQVKQVSLFSAVAEFVLAQTVQPQANLAAASPAITVNTAATPAIAALTPAVVQPAAAPVQIPAQPLITPNPIVAAQFPAVNSAPTTPAPAANAAIATAPAATTAAASASSTQRQLLALNTALYALGLNNSQLAQVDQVATLVKNFNPVAFTSLVYQLEALAQANAQPVAPPLASTSGIGAAAQTAATANAPVTGTTPAAAAGNTAGTNNPGGFQIQELVIKFSSVQGSLTQAGSGVQGGNANLQLSAFNLQVEEINLTLANQAGQALQVTAPQPGTPPLSAPAPAQTKFAAA